MIRLARDIDPMTRHEAARRLYFLTGLCWGAAIIQVAVMLHERFSILLLCGAVVGFLAGLLLAVEALGRE